ncbi:unnamed protein product [Urochloa humidicola]
MSPRLRILSVTHVLPDGSLAAACSPPPAPPMPDAGLVELSFMEALFVDRAMPMRRLFFYEGPGVPLSGRNSPMGQSCRQAGPARKVSHRVGPGPPGRHDGTARHGTIRLSGLIVSGRIGSG